MENWKLPPRLTVEELEEQNARFPRYLWYRKKGKGREFTCTNCRRTFDVLPLGEERTQYPGQALLLWTDHKHEATCPHCGVPGQVRNISLSKSCRQQGKTLTYVKIRREAFDDIYIDCYLVAKNYPNGTRLGDIPIWEFDACYHLTPQGATMAVPSWGRNDITWFSRGTDILEAFLCGYGCGQYHMSYHISNPEALADTFLGRCGYKEYIGRRKDRILYLCNVVKYPALEQLVKAGYREIVDKWIDGTHFRGKLNMHGKSPREILRLSPAECRDILDLSKSDGISLLTEWYKGWDKRFQNFSVLAQLVRLCGFHKSEDFLNKYGYDPAKLISYLNTQFAKRLEAFEHRDLGCHHAAFAIAPTMADTVQHFYDYLNICRQAGLQAEVYPKDVIDAHDRADVQNEERLRRASAQAAAYVREFNERNMRIRLENFQAETGRKMSDAVAADIRYEDKLQKNLRRRIRDYTYTDGKYMIVVPTCAVDLVHEGAALHHCVGTYATKFNKAESDILFIRRVDAADKPLLTMEVKRENGGFRVIQCYGFKDDRALSPTDAWMRDDYHNWLAIYDRSVRKFADSFENFLMSKGEEKDERCSRVG